MQKLLVISNTFDSLVTFRGHLLRSLVAKGREVHVAAPHNPLFLGDPEKTLSEWGVKVHRLSFSPLSLNPLKEIQGFLSLLYLIRKVAPEVVFSYTIKPNIYSGIALRILCRGTRFIPLVNGLGYVFLGTGLKAKVAGALAKLPYRASFKKAAQVLFHNEEDLTFFENTGMIRPGISSVVPGSGVDTNLFPETPLPEGPVTFLFVGRLLKEKGIGEFLEASESVTRAHPTAQFLVAGGSYQGASDSYVTKLNSWVNGTTRQYLGPADDMMSVYRKATVVVLPSYREGLSRTLLEALSVGRPIITTDVPGCREVIDRGKNGVLIPAKDTKSLAEAMTKLLSETQSLLHYAKASRAFAEQKFSVERVVERVGAVLLE